jgi:hypothetical protein
VDELSEFTPVVVVAGVDPARSISTPATTPELEGLALAFEPLALEPRNPLQSYILLLAIPFPFPFPPPPATLELVDPLANIDAAANAGDAPTPATPEPEPGAGYPGNTGSALCVSFLLLRSTVKETGLCVLGGPKESWDEWPIPDPDPEEVEVVTR